MRQPTINYSALLIVVAREILSLFQLYFPNSGNESLTLSPEGMVSPLWWMESKKTKAQLPRSLFTVGEYS